MSLVWGLASSSRWVTPSSASSRVASSSASSSGIASASCGRSSSSPSLGWYVALSFCPQQGCGCSCSLLLFYLLREEFTILDRAGSVISRVVWNQGTGLKGVTELYLRAVRGEGDSPLFKGVPRKAERGYTCSSPQVRPAQRAQRLSHTNLMQS